MWKSLFVARGDIIAFLDADIRDFQPHFVLGVAGPLIVDPALQWVKACYRRPFVLGRAELEGYGGRVTELVVRPLLSAWYPELATVRQPLAGECAFRRDELLQLPFSSGYGVEILLLLQMYRRHGLAGLAQVDLDVRRHRNRPVSQLSLMSFAILRVFFDFLRQDKGMGAAYPLSDELVCVRDGTEERVRVHECVLPPVASVPATAG
jgi:glucosyl-3-phosphoglycerate synthase